MYHVHFNNLLTLPSGTVMCHMHFWLFLYVPSAGSMALSGIVKRPSVPPSSMMFLPLHSASRGCRPIERASIVILDNNIGHVYMYIYICQFS